MAEGPTTRPFEVTHRGVLAVAIPMTAAYLTTPLVGIVNLGAVGQLGDPALVGGVSIGALILDIIFVTFNFLRAGTTGLAAQAYGANDHREVNATFWRAVLLAGAIGLSVIALNPLILAGCLWFIGGSEAVQHATTTYWSVRILGAPLTLVNYVILGWLIGIGRAGFGLLLQIVLNGVNIVLSIAFVQVADMGVAGVGWASVVAEGTAVVAGFAVIRHLMDKDARPSRALLLSGVAFRRLVALNRDIMIRSFALLFAFAFFTSRSATAGDVVLAANEILLNLVMLAAFFLDGLAAAAEQFAGRALGARYRPAFERAVRLTIAWGFVVSLGVSAVLWFGGGWAIDAMTTNAEVRAVARDYLLLASLVPVVGTLAYQMDGVFIGATWSADMRNMMLLSLATYLIAWYFLEAALGIGGLWIALLIFLSMRGGTLVWRMRALIGPAFAT